MPDVIDQHEQIAGIQQLHYVYTFACHEDEEELCGLELRTLLGAVPRGRAIESTVGVLPSRSPFIKLRIAIEAESAKLEGLIELAAEYALREGQTFKIVYAGTEQAGAPQAAFEERQAIARRIGAAIRGTADLKEPDRLIGVAYANGRWVLGEAIEGEAVWLKHNRKPQPYSTALSTRVARAVANIAVPKPQGLTAVDPCCGIGTVVLEALSMGIDIRGYDRNPLASRGARANLAHFGYSAELASKADMFTLEGRYDAAILDLPYNLCSKLPEEEERAMLAQLKRLAPRAVIIGTSPLEERLEQIGWVVTDSCQVRKSAFVRYVYLAERD
ncbi:TRM11 family SAM-dependent methyltransferase [Paenibacillus sp. MMS18-CY102]|uniref:TRM11 family SAM-dependent methyltransferase n=1 Tax=Paenibacillus sp. MMS18-CY102 TaxID=2682849 RepID=UPI001365738F|nr:RNA methyltransferase [Paenibacillus sp. MMS18-CY102]MWC30028.1 RNA methyltransferase [Paenibacillus sp. MMS18-CY102]